MDKLIGGSFNTGIEESVCNRTGSRWKITEVIRGKADDSHWSALIKGTSLNVFVKAAKSPVSLDQFIQEAWGLRYIKSRSCIKTPEVIDVLDINGISLMIFKAVETKPVKDKKDWEVLGRSLAMLHKTTWEKCGLETHSYFGIIKQDNRPMDSWPAFFAERRLRDFMITAAITGKLTVQQTALIEKLISKLHCICGPEQPFSLLHGDPRINNLLFDGKEMIAINCAVYYGNREMDLAAVAFLSAVPDHFFKAYDEVFPIEQGYNEREELWRIQQWICLVMLYGDKYIPGLMEAVNKYI